MNHLCTLCQRTTSPSARTSPYPTTNRAQPPRSEASATGQQAENIPASAQQVKQIAKPPGEVNRPHRGGYNLRTTLAWNEEQWAEVQNFVKLIVTEKLNLSKSFTKQQTRDMNDVRQEILLRFPWLSIYSNFWVINDLVRSQLEYEKKRIQRARNAKIAEDLRAQAARAARRAALEAVDLAFSSS
ncbi:hypothetical protein BT96DRAFT_996069 [Gymnopus androsaceus JB14]|uniref:Uncharacterized protein n=1 Tax=Gymnopus androsaceus JB14 TaxID=1447944 RepID=A0A6A4HJ24_9AGAR|nr:hypothetical protein BT96DRAFT_996069 [Gymnopus androsaceus JB14]